MVNAQAEVLLLLGAPAIFVMLAGAPLVVLMLYSSDFTEAAWILRWQILGDILKLLAWPLSFVLLARGQGRAFFMTEVLAPLVLVLFLWAAAPRIGVYAAGLAFIVMYAVHLPIVLFLVRRGTGFRWHRSVVFTFAGVLAAGCLILALAYVSEAAAFAVGGLAAATSGVYVLGRLRGSDSITSGPLASILRRLDADRT